VSWRVRAERARSYEIRVAEPLLDVGNETLLVGGAVPGRRFVVLDDGVPPEWRSALERYFAAHAIVAHIMPVPGGESFKDVDSVLRVIARLDEFGLDRRNEPVIAIGGGAILDSVGLAASLYRRGVPFIRVPSTLLAFVDAAVGIKTAVNFGSRKNLIGSFEPPLAVLLDRALLRSLPEAEIASGLGEILKLGLGCDRELFERLEAGAGRFGAGAFTDCGDAELLYRAISVMLAELEPNLFEEDLSRAVDLGHTFSQAFELQAGRQAARHGEAVALDLNLSAVIASRRGILVDTDLARLTRLTQRLNLPTSVPEIGPEELWQAVTDRTRHRAGRQRIPLPDAIGSCAFVDDLTIREVAASLDVLRGLWPAGQRPVAPLVPTPGDGAACPAS
jgi:2-epi-5-epi-valiolone synthase